MKQKFQVFSLLVLALFQFSNTGNAQDFFKQHPQINPYQYTVVKEQSFQKAINQPHLREKECVINVTILNLHHHENITYGTMIQTAIHSTMPEKKKICKSYICNT